MNLGKTTLYDIQYKHRKLGVFIIELNASCLLKLQYIIVTHIDARACVKNRKRERFRILHFLSCLFWINIDSSYVNRSMNVNSVSRVSQAMAFVS